MNTTCSPSGLTFTGKQLDGKSFYFAKCRINFARLYQDEDRVLVAREADNQLVEFCFNEIIHNQFPEFPEFAEWKCSRIDYCVNMMVPYINDYIYVLNKGYIRKNLIGQDRTGGSLYKKNKSRHINFYCKASEILKDLGVRDDLHPLEKKKYIEDAREVMRLEVQMLAPGVAYLKRNQKLPENSILDFMKDQMAYVQIEKELRKILLTAPFYSREQAIRMINALPKDAMSDARKKKARDLVYLIAKDGATISKVRENKERLQKGGKSHNGMTKATFNSYRKDLDALGINIVTLRNVCEVERLESIYNLFLQTVHDEAWNLTEGAAELG